MRVMLEIETGEDIEPRYLVDVIMWGIDRHNAIITPAAEAHGDHSIDLMAVTLLGAL